MCEPPPPEPPPAEAPSEAVPVDRSDDALAFAALPLDVLGVIFSFLPLHGRLRVLARVCRRWSGFVRQSITTFRPIYRAECLLHAQRFPSLTALDFVSPKHTRSDVTDCLASVAAWPHLHRLSLLDVTVRGPVPPMRLVTSLRYLTNDSGRDRSVPGCLLDALPSLQHLEIDCAEPAHLLALTGLRSLTYRSATAATVIPSLPMLTRLEAYVDGSPLLLLNAKLPSLRALSLASAALYTSHVQQLCTVQYTALTSLRIPYSRMDSTELFMNTKLCGLITALGLHTSDLPYESIPDMIASMPALTCLDLRPATASLRPGVLRTLLTRLPPTLRELRLPISHCMTPVVAAAAHLTSLTTLGICVHAHLVPPRAPIALPAVRTLHLRIETSKWSELAHATQVLLGVAPRVAHLHIASDMSDADAHRMAHFGSVLVEARSQGVETVTLRLRDFPWARLEESRFPWMHIKAASKFDQY